MTKKALCVGINDYPFGEANDLRGCVNDANDWSNLLRNHYDFTDVKQLLDSEATKANILAGLKDLLAKASDGDVLVFTNASHGTYLADKDGDEPKFDEAICPHDTDSELLVDDELRNLFLNIPKGVRLTVISDSCHSGSVTRVKESEYRRNRQLSPSLLNNRILSDEEMKTAQRNARAKKEKYPESGMNEILLSGCKSNQVSADAHIAGDYHGAMSYYAIKAITDAGYNLTYKELHDALLPALAEENYTQQPELEGKDENKQRAIFT